MKLNLRQRMQRGDRVYGTAIISTAPHWVPAVAKAGLDFVFIDRPGPPILTSGVALRQAGFHETMYTDEMFAKWFARYRADGLLPPG